MDLSITRWVLPLQERDAHERENIIRSSSGIQTHKNLRLWRMTHRLHRAVNILANPEVKLLVHPVSGMSSQLTESVHF